jgi:uncharacterized protein YjgD (DUF1641 family)
MAEPQRSVPESATLGAAKERVDGDGTGREALERALAAHGEDLAAAVDRTDELDDALTTAILVAASADDDEVEYITDSAANLVRAADGLSTDGAADLANELGDNADDLSASMETLVTLQQQGHLDDLVRVATAFSESLSPSELDRLAGMLETGGGDVVDALERVLELQQTGQLDELLDLAETASALELDDDGVAALNEVLGAVGDARRDAEPVGFLGAVGALRGADARAGLGYALELLQALGRRVR